MTFVLKYSYVLSSQKKLALVAQLICGKDIKQAIDLLTYLPNKASLTVLKVLKTAVNNMKQEQGVDPANMMVARYDLGPGPKLKRMRAVGRSRMHGYVKHRASFALHLATK
ncbi:MAG: hypothetical protein RL023_201 [Candidatus Parcubacteria bacterium]|jgi:large subunit ribosomal protein L22